MLAGRLDCEPLGKRGYVGARGLAGRSECDLSVVHDENLIGCCQREMQVLGGEEAGLTLPPETLDHGLQGSDDHRRQSLERFVEKKNGRLAEQRSGQRKHLLLAAGQLQPEIPPPFCESGKQRVRLIERFTRPILQARNEILVHGQGSKDVSRLRHVTKANARTRRTLAVTALCASTNWLLYVWAVTHGHVVEGSLGYFINPLVNVLLGVVVLGERLNRVQTAAVALAGLGVAYITWAAGRPLLLKTCSMTAPRLRSFSSMRS